MLALTFCLPDDDVVGAVKREEGVPLRLTRPTPPLLLLPLLLLPLLLVVPDRDDDTVARDGTGKP